MSSLYGTAALRKDREADAAPPTPQFGDLGRLVGSVHGDRVVGERLLELCGDAASLARRAVGLGDHHEGAAVGDPERIGVARVRQRDGVQVLDGGRNDPGAEHALDRADARLGVAVQADHGQLELRRGDQPQPRGGNEAQCALGADEQALDVVPRDVFADRPADVHDLAGRDHRLEPGDPVPRHAVFEGVGATGVARDVAADLRDLGRARVGGEAEAALACEPLHVSGRDARLDVHAPEQRIELADLVQTLETEHDAALDRDRPAGEPGAAAAGGQRDVMLVAPAHDCCDLFGCVRKHNRVGGSLDAAAHQIGEIATLRLVQRLGRDNLCELHVRERTLWGQVNRTIRGDV